MEDKLIKRFLSTLDPKLYEQIRDKRLARSLLNRDGARELYFLYKYGYLNGRDEVLKYAIREGRETMIRELMDNNDVNPYLVEIAAEVGNKSLTYELIGRCPFEEDVIYMAVKGAARGGYSDFAETLELLLPESSDGARDFITEGELEGGFTRGSKDHSMYQLATLAKGGQIANIKEIVDDGSDFTEIAVNTVENGHINIVKYAIDNGADPMTVMKKAVECYRMDMIHYIEKYDIDWLQIKNEATIIFTDMAYYINEKLSVNRKMINGREKVKVPVRKCRTIPDIILDLSDDESL